MRVCIGDFVLRVRVCVCVCFSAKHWLSEVAHLMFYRICARGLSATIRYHNKCVHGSSHAQCTYHIASHAQCTYKLDFTLLEPVTHILEMLDVYSYRYVLFYSSIIIYLSSRAHQPCLFTH